MKRGSAHQLSALASQLSSRAALYLPLISTEVVVLLDEKDWRPRLELLARVFPDEYGRREIVQQVEQELPQTLPKVVLNTNGKTLEEITNFPMDDPAPQPDAPKPQADEAKPTQRVPLVGLGGKVVRWVDAPEQDADPEADLP